jgi:acyl-coenzyme A thioesterase PaaI-like protein
LRTAASAAGDDEVTMEPAPGVDFADCLDLEFVRVTAEGASAIWYANETHCGPNSCVHHGAVSAVAESVAYAAAQAWSGLREKLVSVSIVTDFAAEHLPGRFDVVAVPVDRAADSQLWDVEIRTGTDNLCARSVIRFSHLTE